MGWERVSADWVRGRSVDNAEAFGLLQVRIPVTIIDQTGSRFSSLNALSQFVLTIPLGVR